MVEVCRTPIKARVDPLRNPLATTMQMVANDIATTTPTKTIAWFLDAFSHPRAVAKFV
jgi:hypothetical protein